MLMFLGQFLVGLSAGLGLSALASADEQATERCAYLAQRRVDRLREEADHRVAAVHSRYGAQMGRAAQAAFQRRLGS